MRERVAVLGATGSIGRSTLDLMALHQHRFRPAVLAAHRRADRMAELCEEFLPDLAVMTDSDAAAELQQLLAHSARARGVRVASGVSALTEAAAGPDVDTVVAGIVGAAGLPAAIAAARAGKKILLANKEALVMAGSLMVEAAREGGATILPIDSEHNAIFQCLGENYRCFSPPRGVTRLLLTASGGPFRTWSPEAIAQATVSQAIAHPNWSMGPKISVDSATMMNKGLELIEAHWLFSLPESCIDVVIHPQSVVHSMVEYADGSTLAQLGSPDMRTPIACALSWPQRMDAPVARLDWTAARKLDFEPPDDRRFPCLGLARQILRGQPGQAAVLNAANEIAVAAFLAGRLRFGQIFAVVSETLSRIDASGAARSLQELLDCDAASRRCAEALCLERAA